MNGADSGTESEARRRSLFAALVATRQSAPAPPPTAPAAGGGKVPEADLFRDVPRSAVPPGGVDIIG